MLTAAGTSWVIFKNIYFHGNRWNGATSSAFELDLNGCSYCQVASNALFIGSPGSALGDDTSVPQAVDYVNFQGGAYVAVYSGGKPQCPYPAYWSPHVCLNVVGSYFYSGGVNALGFDLKNAQIAYNVFSGNHAECPYNAPGGQIDLDTGSDTVTVVYNTFENGPSCSNGWWAVGVELHGTNLTLTDNLITYNAGEGIYMDGAQNVSISSTNPSSYYIAHNNQRGSGFPGCGGFPGIRVHSSYSQGRATQNVSIQNVWSISGHSYGVEVSSRGTTGPLINYITIQNNCVAGNLVGGVYTPGAGSPQTINNNQTSGCGGY